MQAFKVSNFLVCVPVESPEAKLIALFQTLTKSLLLVPEATWTLVKEQSFGNINPETTEILLESSIIIGADVDETQVFETWKQQHVHDNSHLNSKVLVTRQCNNRCRYCILDHSAAVMSRDTARAMDAFYLDTIEEKRPQKVEDDYLGGEPLLNTEILIGSASRRRRYCDRNQIDYGFTITTNGTLLTLEVIEKLKEAGLTGLRVSMAVPARIHDNLRPSKTGGRTYDTILKNLRAISGSIPIIIECQYDAYRLFLEDYIRQKAGEALAQFDRELPEYSC